MGSLSSLSHSSDSPAATVINRVREWVFVPFQSPRPVTERDRRRDGVIENKGMKSARRTEVRMDENDGNEPPIGRGCRVIPVQNRVKLLNQSESD